jgi:lipid-binding SYLF domain-containing protein
MTVLPEVIDRSGPYGTAIIPCALPHALFITLQLEPDGSGTAKNVRLIAQANSTKVARFEHGRGPLMATSSPLTKRLLALGAGLLFLTSMAWSADDKDQSDIDKRLDASAKVLNEIMATPDKAIPDKVMSGAKCIAVIPSMVKIAVGFGGNHGKGVATCRMENGHWSAPAPITITGGSWGLQLGGQAVDLVLIVTNEDGMQHLLSSKFKIGADASAVAGPVGRDTGADTDWKMKAEVLTYSRARGLFAGIDLNGSAVTQDKDETRVLYGSFVPFSDIFSGKVRPKETSEPFLAAVRKYSGQAKEHSELRPPAGTDGAGR